MIGVESIRIKSKRRTLRWCKTWCWDKLARERMKRRLFFRFFFLRSFCRWDGNRSLFSSHEKKSGSERRQRKQSISLIFQQRDRLTFLPAWLLCKFISVRASPSISRTSRNFRANLTPKSISTEQPPHFQFCCGNIEN